MKALLLDAASAEDLRSRSAADSAARALEARGFAVERFAVRDLDVKPCTGCFGCWVAQPGQCVIPDDAGIIAERAITAEVLAIVSPVVFGSYGSAAKSVLDRMICLVLPHFTMVDGEVHHQPRYMRYPISLALGTLPVADEEQQALFARLVERNAVNLHNPAHGSAIVVGDQDAEPIITRLLNDVLSRAEVAA